MLDDHIHALGGRMQPVGLIEADIPGDTVEIDAGTYACDTSVKWNANFLTLRGVNGRAVMKADGCAPLPSPTVAPENSMLSTTRLV